MICKKCGKRYAHERCYDCDPVAAKADQAAKANQIVEDVVAGRREPPDADQFAREVGLTEGQMARAEREYPMRTLSELAQEALDVQNACNLSGVVHGWSRAISDLRKLMPTADTEAINRHPINKLWADKVADLAGVPTIVGGDWSLVAYGAVQDMAHPKLGVACEPLKDSMHPEGL
jgi:hypothetical protein